MKPFVLFTHVPLNFTAAYLPAGTPHASIRQPWLGGQYTEWAKEHSLRSVLLEHGWRGEPVVLIGWSAGVFPIRQWLRDPKSRDLVAGAVLLDGLHSPGPPCTEDAVAPVVAFARTGRPLVVTASHIVPGSYASAKDCLDLLRARLPAGSRAELFQGPDSDHVAHVRDHGPRLTQTVLWPQLGAGWPPSGTPWLGLVAAGVVGALVGFGAWLGTRRQS